MANTVNNPSGGSVDGGGARPFDWTSLGTKDSLNDFPVFHTSSPVICKDGSTKIQQSSPNAKYMDACINNGGRAENQTVVNAVAYQPVVNLSPEEKFYESLGLKSSMFSPLKSKGRLLVLVVLVGGYFAYKKFKK